MYNYISNYKGRTDLVDLYGDNSLLLYALQLRYDIEDIISVASEALTDGSDDKLVEEWKAILDVLMPWHSTLEPAIVSGLKSKEATQNAAKQLRATLTSFSSMYAQQLKPFSDSINTDM